MKKVLPFLLLFFLSHSVASNCNTERFSATAFNTAGEAQYKETHRFRYCNKTILSSRSDYFSTAGEPLAVLSANYQNHTYLPAYDFEDFILKVEHGAEWVGDDFFVYQIEAGEKNREQVDLQQKRIITSGQGLHFIIRDNFDSLLAGDKVNVKFLLSTRNLLVDFRIRLKSMDEENKEVWLYAEVSNWVARLFAPRLKMRYSMDSVKLLEYIGPTVINTKDGKPETVRILYQH